MKNVILPSVLTKTQRQLKTRLQIVSRYTERAQLDVLDGSFLPYRDYHDPAYITALRPQVSLEVHLMVGDVLGKLSNWNRFWVKKIIFHAEAVSNHRAVIGSIGKLKKKAGMALNPETPLAIVLPYVSILDTVLIMTVKPGRNAAPFVASVMSKIKNLRKKNRRVNIEVDGGINPDTARLCVRAGANLLAVGSYLKNEIFAERWRRLNEAIHENI
ncbi:MAG: ribulose-phosphate 3-epimerase [Candidatus Doudnabacteria bacterium]|nr:ribulose-phosphate 3-epimerase [Candidatus Doudnabacteria bacterium]